jgi:hypothetical protein
VGQTLPSRLLLSVACSTLIDAPRYVRRFNKTPVWWCGGVDSSPIDAGRGSSNEEAGGLSGEIDCTDGRAVQIPSASGRHRAGYFHGSNGTGALNVNYWHADPERGWHPGVQAALIADHPGRFTDITCFFRVRRE